MRLLRSADSLRLQSNGLLGSFSLQPEDLSASPPAPCSRRPRHLPPISAHGLLRLDALRCSSADDETLQAFLLSVAPAPGQTQLFASIRGSREECSGVAAATKAGSNGDVRKPDPPESEIHSSADNRQLFQGVRGRDVEVKGRSGLFSWRFQNTVAHKIDAQ